MDVHTFSFFGSLSRSTRSTDLLTFRARLKAIKPPVLMSLSLRSILDNFVVSARYSAIATAPVQQKERQINS